MECAFIDLQGFVYNSNTFNIKEICVLTKNTKFHEFVKPPFPSTDLKENDKKHAEWLEENHHGLNWDTGYITLQELKNTISPIVKGKILFVKGSSKVKWLKDILCDENILCINIEDIDCKFKLNKDYLENQFSCKKHKYPNSHCARTNAGLLKKWFYSQSVYSNRVKNLIETN